MWGDVPGKAFPHLLLHELLLLPAPLVHRTGAELTACHTSRPPVQYPISASVIKAQARHLSLFPSLINLRFFHLLFVGTYGW